MAERKVIQYVVEIDTAAGKAELRDLVQGESAGGAGGGGPGGAGAGSKEPTPGEQADRVEDIWAVLLTRMKTGAGGMMQMGQGGQGFMAGMGQMLGMIPGKLGMIASTVTEVSNQLVGLGISLSDFDGALFEAKTKWDFFWMGFKIELAEGLSEALANLMDAVMDLAESVLPSLIEGLKLMANILSPVIRGIARTWEFAEEGAQTFYESAVEGASDMIGGIGRFLGLLPDAEDLGISQEEFDKQMQNNSRIMQETFHQRLEEHGLLGEINNALEDLDDRLKAVNREYSLMEKGFQVSRATLTMLEGFAYGTDRQGAQGDVGLRKDTGISLGAGSGDGSDSTGMDVSEASPAFTHSAASGMSASPSSFPRPTSASVNFKVTDAVNINAGDESQMLQELMAWKNDVMQMVLGLSNPRWMRLATARHSVERGMIGGGA